MSASGYYSDGDWTGLYAWCRAISNLYYLMGKFGIRDRGEARSTTTFDQLEKVTVVVS